MGYNTGHDILDDEYNIFASGSASGTPNHSVTNVNTVFGSGTGNKGWGQTLPVSPVSAGSDITATQWATLLNAINTAANHQNTTISAITSPVTGDDIEVLANLQSNITDIFDNRLNCAATGTPINDTVTRTSTWSSSVTATFTVNFSSYNDMRYFFNTGGRITLSGSRTGGSSNPKNTAWTDLLSNIGTLHLASPSGSNTANIAGTTYNGFTKTGGSGTPSTYLTGTGMYDLTSSYVELFKQYASTSLYTVNYVRLRARRSGSTLYFEMQYVDAENTPEENVDGNTNFFLSAIPADTTYISNSWGTPSISGSQSGS